MWVVYPREGSSVNIKVRFGRVCLSSDDPDWHIIWEEKT